MNSGKQIRVCQVLHGIVGGGSEQVVLNYCSRLPEIHFDMLYQYEPNQQILERFKEANINCVQIPDKVHHPLRHLWTMYKLFKEGQYDVVHSHLDWYMNSYVCFLAMLAGVKKRIAHHHQAYISDCHRDLRTGISWLIKIFLCSILRIPCKFFATHWLACGEAAAINGWGKSAVAKGYVTILPNAIDPERFKFNENTRKEIRERYGIANDDFLIGHVGRFFAEKNHKFIIGLFKDVLHQRANSWLLLVGDGPLQQEIQNAVKELGMENKVFFAGLQKDVVPFYCAMDVLLLPSTREAFPMTLVEAQYNGLPCIVSDEVPKESAITENVYSLSTEEMEPWSKKLDYIRVKNAQRIIDIIDSRFDINHCYKKLESFYQIP